MPRTVPLLILMLTATLGLAGCQSTGGGMTALAPAGALSSAQAPLKVVAVQGPQTEAAQKFEAVFLEEAQKRGFSAAGSTGPAMRVKAYLDAYPAEGGKTGFSWVIDTSEDGRTRAIRIKGGAEMAGGGASPWSAFDETAMRQIAGLAVEDMIRQIQGGGQIAASGASTPEE